MTLALLSKSDADLASSAQSIERARNAIAKEAVVTQIPASSPELDYVVQLLSETSQDWDIALIFHITMLKCVPQK